MYFGYGLLINYFSQDTSLVGSDGDNANASREKSEISAAYKPWGYTFL